ncbi:MAG: anti-sigma factor family protein [Burkholderiales bacterium]
MTLETVREDDLHAYIDRALDAGRSQQIEAWLEQQADVARAVQAYRSQVALLHAAFDSVLTEPLPARLMSPAHRRRPLWRVASAMSWLIFGTLLGWTLHGMREPAPAPALPQHAAVAHAAFVTEVRHPVEVRASEEKHLVGWLSKRLGTPIRAPKLSAHGFELLGGRLLPESARPGAQLMYQDAAGRRLTLYLSADVATRDSAIRTRDGAFRTRDSAFSYVREGAVHVFYWTDRSLGYALSGELDKAEMLTLARTIYQQMNP